MFELSKPVVISVYQDGTLTFFERGSNVTTAVNALPVHTVDSLEAAMSLCVASCKLAYDNRTYVLNPDAGFDGTVESLDSVAAYMQRVEGIINQREKAHE